MKYTVLGNSGIKTSSICLGCMGFGDPNAGMHSWTLDEAQSREIISRSLDAGINFFDTAIAYQGGTSEQYLGHALKGLTTRDKVVVATKFPARPKTFEHMDGRKYVETMLDRSLKNLGMDYVDLYILHGWDYGTPLMEIMQGLDDAVRAGKARAIGVSNCFAYQLAKANAMAEKEGLTKFTSVQNHYNLIFREEEREMAKLCSEDGIATTPYSALASGRLSRMPDETTKRMAEDAYARGKYDATAAQDEVIIRRVAQLAEEKGASMTAVALAWLMSKTTAPVVGATKPRHIYGAVEAAELELSGEECAWLEEPYVPHKLVGMMAR